MEQTNNRTIARNTLLLYGRAILMMLIGLYTSRVILQALGVSDFGVYNVVGGVLGLFGFISGSLGNATSRFITISIGNGDQEYTNKTFGNIKLVYYALAAIIFILGETVGLWFLLTYLVIPPERMTAAIWVYQFSVLSVIMSLVCVPYNSAIIAHERMSAFAYISLLDAVFKLLVCFLIQITPFDRLIFYSFLLFIIGNVDRLIYRYYCRRHFEEVRVKAKLFKEQFLEIMRLSGWAVSGNVICVSYTQGLNMLLNMFFGPVVNAARGVALQVQGVISQFVGNFQTAINPQLTKSYGSMDFARMHQLFIMDSKISFMLLFVPALPIMLEAPFILRVWLTTVPQYTVVFLRVILAYELAATLAGAFNTSILATGEMKWFQIFDGITRVLIFPATYIAFKFFHAEPVMAFIILGISEVLSLTAKTFIVFPLIEFPIKAYLKEVVFRLLAIIVVSSVIPLFVLGLLQEGWIRFMIVLFISVACTFCSIWLFGLKREERELVIAFVKSKLNKFRSE